VSVYTASRALSGHPGVAGETRRRVQDAATRLGYVANQNARNLKGATSRVIGLVAASKVNPYYAELVAALEDAVEPRGYSCFVADAVMNGVYSHEREDRIVRSMIEQRVAAVVVTCAISETNLTKLRSWGIPVLFVDCLPPESWGTQPGVSSDNFAGGLAMGEHLARLGYRRWCFIGHPETWSTRAPRQMGFEAAATNAGATVEVVEGGNDARTARRSVIALLTRLSDSDRPQALFASNSVLLAGALLALRDCRIEPPTDVAIVAFDDFDWAELLKPSMTVVDQHIDVIGRTTGMQILYTLGDLDYIPDGAAGRVLIAPTLRVRESCGSRIPPDKRAGSEAHKRLGSV